jgi:thioredoxin 1
VLTPLLKSVTEKGSEYDLVTIDVDEHPELAAEYKVSERGWRVCDVSMSAGGGWQVPLGADVGADEQITALPTVIGFRDGKVKNKFGMSARLMV